MAALKEIPLPFGEGGRLLGVLTVPPQPRRNAPVLLIPNTGLEHRVGPNRLHVQMARALAAAGYQVLRFDIAGLGDSDPAPGCAASAVDDLGQAVEALLARGPGTRFVILGLCSGASDAHQYARRDPRIAGAVFIDGYTYQTARFRRLRWRRRLLQPGRLLQRLRQWRTAPVAKPPGIEVDLFRSPPLAQAAADYQVMLARGMRLAFLFTGDVQYSYLYADQLYDAFPELRHRVALHYLPHTDHTLTRRSAREELIALLKDWLLGFDSV